MKRRSVRGTSKPSKETKLKLGIVYIGNITVGNGKVSIGDMSITEGAVINGLTQPDGRRAEPRLCCRSLERNKQRRKS